MFKAFYNRIWGNRNKRYKITVACILGLLLTVRLALPSIVKHQILKGLNDMEGYSAHLEDVDLILVAGGMTLKGLKIFSDKSAETPLFKADEIDCQLQWNALLNGKFVGVVKFIHPTLDFVVGVEGEAETNFEDVEKVSWQQELKELAPLTINELIIYNGEIHYKDLNYNALIDINLMELNAAIHNLTNSQKSMDIMFGSGEMNALLMGHAPLHAEATFDPLDESGTFDLDLSLDELNLPELNNFTSAYAGVDTESGKFSLYSEIAADSGNVRGYLKPITEKLKMLNLKKDLKEGLIETIWEGSVGLGLKLITNPKESQVASKLEFTGEADRIRFKYIKGMGYTFYNLLIKALRKQVDNSIELELSQH